MCTRGSPRSATVCALQKSLAVWTTKLLYNIPENDLPAVHDRRDLSRFRGQGAPWYASLTSHGRRWERAKIIIFSRTHCHFEGFTSAVPSHTCVHVGHPGQLLSVPYRNPWQCGQLNYYIIFPKMISRQSTTGEIYPDFGATVRCVS